MLYTIYYILWYIYYIYSVVPIKPKQGSPWIVENAAGSQFWQFHFRLWWLLCAELRIPLPSKLWTSTAPNGDTMHKFQTFANFSHLNGNSIQPTNCQIIFAVSLQIKDKNVWQLYTVDSSGQWSHRLIYRRNRVGHKWKYDARSTTWWQLMWNRCTRTLQKIVLSFDITKYDFSRI